MNLRKVISSLFFATVAFFVSFSPTYAHVIVKPSQAGIASTQTFDVSVPTEKETATTGIRITIPDGLKEVTPNVKNGWNVEMTKTEISWTGGSIPSGQRDDFYFSAQVPSKATVIKWDAYQTFEDGTVTEWTHAPSKNPEDETAPAPYSTTTVINDLKPTGSVDSTPPAVTNNLSLVLSLVAIALSATAFVASRKK